MLKLFSYFYILLINLSQKSVTEICQQKTIILTFYDIYITLYVIDCKSYCVQNVSYYFIVIFTIQIGCYDIYYINFIII